MIGFVIVIGFMVISFLLLLLGVFLLLSAAAMRPENERPKSHEAQTISNIPKSDNGKNPSDVIRGAEETLARHNININENPSNE